MSSDIATPDLQPVDTRSNAAPVIDTVGTSLAASTAVSNSNTNQVFLPLEPSTWDETELTFTQVGGLVMKYLLNVHSATGRRIADQLKMPFHLVQELLLSLRNQKLLGYSGSAQVNDYQYELTSAGTERAREFTSLSTYCGAAPVSLEDYCTSIAQQSFKKCRPRMAQIRSAFSDLLLGDEMLGLLGQAVNAGRGLFIFGAPGNGKSVMAERLVQTASDYIWIPRALSVGGDVIRLFDPATHKEAPTENSHQLLRSSRIDKRWVKIRRPTVVAGGELTLQNLEVTFNAARGVNEAPLQLKSNGGVLVIDDFGRQRVSTRELLNRFIIPLEKGCDYVSLPTGRQVQVPFDQMLVFSTNLEPAQLCDEAFMRRIPYKLEAVNPTEIEFRSLFLKAALQSGIVLDDTMLEYIFEFYRRCQRPFRFCHPRDLLQQVQTYCEFNELPLEVTPATFDIAAKSYFAGT